MLAAIWSDLDKLLSPRESDNNKENEKPAQLSLVKNFCVECHGVKVISPEGLPTCSMCGLVEDSYIDQSPEWTSGLTDDGRVSDPSRCIHPNANPDLFSASWGKSTMMSTTAKKVSRYENRRLSRINLHMSMNHKDRTLYHAYKEIDEACHLHLPDNILSDAKRFYKYFTQHKLTRGGVRKGVKANCVLMSCKYHTFPRSAEEIASMFHIDIKDVTRTAQLTRDVLRGSVSGNTAVVVVTESANAASTATKPRDIMQRLLNNFQTTREHRFACNKLCSEIEDCVELMSKTPKSVASTCIYMTLSDQVTKAKVCEICGLSVPTLNKIEIIIKNHLESKM